MSNVLGVGVTASLHRIRSQYAVRTHFVKNIAGRHIRPLHRHWHGRTKPPAWIREHNEWMNCHVKDELVSQLVALNNKLNLLSPDLVHGDEERAEVQQQRENLYAEIKRHKAKGHQGKPCPAARQV